MNNRQEYPQDESNNSKTISSIKPRCKRSRSRQLGRKNRKNSQRQAREINKAKTAVRKSRRPRQSFSPRRKARHEGCGIRRNRYQSKETVQKKNRRKSLFRRQRCRVDER